MATPLAQAQNEEIGQSDFPEGFRYVARQPILDLRGRLHGYELLYRNGIETCFTGDGDMATRTMLDNSVLFGIENLAGGVTAFVNCTREALTDALVDVLPPSMTVLEILENIEPTPTVIEACRKLKIAGFRLALDDFVWKSEFAPLVALADYVKVDFLQTSPLERKWLLQRLSQYPVALIAEKIETCEQYQQARVEGFTLIQGYYFCRPVLLKNRNVPSNRLPHIEILRLLNDDSLDLRRLSSLVKRDTSLTYRLLRLINSPLCAVRQEVVSVEGGSSPLEKMSSAALPPLPSPANSMPASLKRSCAWPLSAGASANSPPASRVPTPPSSTSSVCSASSPPCSASVWKKSFRPSHSAKKFARLCWVRTSLSATFLPGSSIMNMVTGPPATQSSNP